MTDHSAAMTTARMQIVQLRLQGLTLAALVQRGVLRPEWASGLVRNAAEFLHAPTNDPALEKLLQDALEEVAKDLDTSRPLIPLREK